MNQTPLWPGCPLLAHGDNDDNELMRLFIGVDLPSNVKQEIQSYLSPLQTTFKGWEKPHDFHLTLLFIGEVEPYVCETIKQRLDQIIFRSFTLTIGPLAFFNRRVAYLSLLRAHDLLELRELLRSEFPEWAKEHKPFLPHITVKRWQRYEYYNLEFEARKTRFSPINVEVKNLSLFESKKDEKQHKYHVIYERSL